MQIHLGFTSRRGNYCCAHPTTSCSPILIFSLLRTSFPSEVCCFGCCCCYGGAIKRDLFIFVLVPTLQLFLLLLEHAICPTLLENWPQLRGSQQSQQKDNEEEREEWVPHMLRCRVCVCSCCCPFVVVVVIVFVSINDNDASFET